MLDAVKEMTCLKALEQWRGWQFTSACAKQAESNHGVVKLKTQAHERFVSDEELELAVKVGRELGWR